MKKKKKFIVEDTWEKGFRVAPYSYTPKTKRKSRADCGFEGVVNLISGLEKFKSASYMSILRKNLKFLGYISGLTVQAVPYDWRKSSQMDVETSKYLPKLIKFMNFLTNKKIVLMGHSMGNFRILHSLYGMSQESKDKYIKNFIAIAPPFLGAVKAIFQSVCGNEKFDYKVFGIKFGLKAKSLARILKSLFSVYELLPSNTYMKHSKEEWMMKIKERIRYEMFKTNDPVFDWLPGRNEICFKMLDHKCKSGLFDFWDFGDIQGHKIHPENLYTILKKYSFFEKKKAKFGIDEKMENKNFQSFPNPGVSVILIHAISKKTPARMFVWSDNPKNLVEKKNEYCELHKDYNFYYRQGDGTVSSTSSVTPVVKWGYEFEKKLEKHAKPVKIVELCSNRKQEKRVYENDFLKGVPEVYDDLRLDREFEMKKNEFISLEGCKRKDKGTIIHDKLMLNENLNKFVLKVLVGNDKPGKLKFEVEQKIEEKDLENLVNSCYMGYRLRKMVEEKFKGE